MERPQQKSLVEMGDLESATLLSIFSQRLDDLSDGGYWHDLVSGTQIGTTLSQIKREAVSPETIPLAKASVEEALSWLRPLGYNVAVNVTQANGTFNIRVLIDSKELNYAV